MKSFQGVDYYGCDDLLTEEERSVRDTLRRWVENEYMPEVQHYFEQEVFVAERLKRHRSGIKMMYSETTPEILAQQIITNLGKNVDYSDIPIDGAKKAAQLIGNLF